MSATITDKFKRQVLLDLYNSFHNVGLDSGQDSDRYYVGLGRSEAWSDDNSPPSPSPSKNDIRDFQSSLQGMKRIIDLSYVVPRHNWSAGSVYTAWSNDRHSDTSIGALQEIEGSYYVITDEHNVYVCIQQGITDAGVVRNSIYKPTEVSFEPFEAGPDGYVWKFMYNVGVFNSRRYLTSEYIPVEQILDSSEGGPAGGSLSASRIAQVLIQFASIPGQVLGADIKNGGSNYSSTDVITITGDHEGDSATAYPRVDVNGSIFQVVMKDSSNSPSYNFGAGYGNRTTMSINSSTGTGAKLLPIVHLDSGGLGHDPRTDLMASALMYSVRFVGTEENVFSTTNDFRQVALIKNPMRDSLNNPDHLLSVGDSAVSAVRGSTLRKLYVGSGIDITLTDLDNTVRGASSGAVAFVDYYRTYVDSDCCDSDLNTTHNVLYVHQSDSTGYEAFEKGELVELSDAAGAATVIAHADSDIPALRYADIDAFSGEVFYVNNRLPIDRDEDQTEDIKIVIDL